MVTEPWLPLLAVDATDIFDLNRLLVLMLLAIGLALVAGNGFAIIQTRRGVKPKDEEGEFRPARAWWLLAVGVLMTVWGLASL
jgi:hypothetical protein